MIRYVPLVLFALATPASAQLVHKIQSSVQLSVDAAAAQTTRLGSSYSVSGTGVSTTDGTTAGVVGGFGSLTNGVPAITNITASQATSGAAFSFSQSITEGDSTSTSRQLGGHGDQCARGYGYSRRGRHLCYWADRHHPADR
jgi:hypothetical protein